MSYECGSDHDCENAEAMLDMRVTAQRRKNAREGHGIFGHQRS